MRILQVPAHDSAIVVPFFMDLTFMSVCVLGAVTRHLVCALGWCWQYLLLLLTCPTVSPR